MPEGSRVVSAEVRCASCTVPSYSPLNDTEYYKVIVTQFLLDGGDGHIMIEEANPERLRMQKTVREAVNQYLQHHKLVYPEVEGRIEFRAFLENVTSSSAIKLFSCLDNLWISTVSLLLII